MDTAPIVRLKELRERGATYREAHRQVAGLQRLTTGAYASITGLSREEIHLTHAHALLTRLAGTVVSHTTAGVAWGLPVPWSALRTVQLSPGAERRGNSKSGPGYHLHCRAVPESELDIVDSLLVTSPLRTVVDCASMVSMDWAVAIADSALHSGAINADELALAAAGIRRVKGAGRMRQLPDLSSHLAESPGESLLRLRLRRMGLEVIEQHPMPWIPGNPRVDFLVGDRLIVEFDGQQKYSLEGDPGRAHWEEKRRHDLLVEDGNEVLHVVWEQLWNEAELSRRVSRAQDRARRRAPSSRTPDSRPAA